MKWTKANLDMRGPGVPINWIYSNDKVMYINTGGTELRVKGIHVDWKLFDRLDKD